MIQTCFALRRLAAALIGVICVLAIDACDKGGPAENPTPVLQSVSTVEISPATAKLVVAGTTQLSTILRDANGQVLSGRTVAWSSSGSAIATVSATGVVTGVAPGGPVQITATAESKLATALVTVSLPTEGQIGPSGGTLATASGATVSFSPGAIRGTVMAQVRDTQPEEPRYLQISERALVLVLPIENSSAQPTGNVTLSIPTTREVRAGTTAYVRARFKGIEGDFWATATAAAGGRLTLEIPADGLSEFRTMFGLTVLEAVFDAEEFEGTTTSPGGAKSSLKLGENCQALPAGAAAKGFAPCDFGTLQRLKFAGSGPEAEIGIVLVHGWGPQVADWTDYFAAQGIVCRNLIFKWSCNVDLVTQSFATLPGSIYFRSLLRPLGAETEPVLSRPPIYTFDYQSYRNILTSAADLGTALRAEKRNRNLAGFVIIGHSMGGLVAREAAQLLEAQDKSSQIVLGIITLASPHLGTPLPATSIAKKFASGVSTPGGQDLINSVPRNEKALLRMFGGKVFGPPTHNSLVPGYYVFCPFASPCVNDNDGAVPLYSSLPSGFDSPTATRHPEALGYDHTQMVEGLSPASFGTDLLYQQIRTDLRELLTRAGAVTLTFENVPVTAQIGAPLSASLAVTVRDAMGVKISSTIPYQVTVAIAGNSAGATLSGTKTVIATGGTADFSGLSVDRAGAGYRLVATAVGLTATSPAFTVVVPPPTNVIVAAPSTISFAGTTGAAVPATQNVAISNANASVLNGLLVANITYGSGETSGWLSAPSLGASTTPTVLTLRPNTTTLATGTYHATVYVAASGSVSNSPLGVNVTYVVSSPGILPAPVQLTPANGEKNVSATPTFSWSAVPGANRYWLMIATSPNAFPTNLAATSCTLCVMSGFTSATTHTLPNAFPNGADGAGADVLLNGVPYYWRVQAFNSTPSPNIVGNYTPSSGFTTISAAAGPTIQLNRAAVAITAIKNGPNPNAELFAISNAGSGTLNALSLSTSYQIGQPTGWLSASLSTTTSPAVVTLSATPGSLAIGTYTATVAISSGSAGVTNSPQFATVTLSVVAQPSAPVITLSSSSVSFSAVRNSGNPPAQSVHIGNAGAGSLTALNTSVSYQSGQVTGWLTASLVATTAPTSVVLTPSLGSLAVGTYTATVSIASNVAGVVNSPQLVTVSFTVLNTQVGQPSKLVFVSSPANIVAGTAFTPAIQVGVADAAGNIISSATNHLVLLGVDANGASFNVFSDGYNDSDNTSINAVNGIATFQMLGQPLKAGNAGTGLKLVVIDCGSPGPQEACVPVSQRLTGATSAPFSITIGPAARVRFSVEPSTTSVGSVLTPAVRVRVTDDGGNTITNAANAITVAVSPGTGSPGATLSGTRTISAVNGISIFSTLSINTAGSAYRLSATASGLILATSYVFDIQSMNSFNMSLPSMEFDADLTRKRTSIGSASRPR